MACRGLVRGCSPRDGAHTRVPSRCARGIIDAWNYCQTSFGTYETTVMDDDQKAVVTLIDWDEARPGPCMATFRSYIDERLAEVATGPCAMAYNNCVGGSEKGLCSRNIEDAIVSLQSEYAREDGSETCAARRKASSGCTSACVRTMWRVVSVWIKSPSRGGCRRAPSQTSYQSQCQNLVSREASSPRRARPRRGVDARGRHVLRVLGGMRPYALCCINAMRLHVRRVCGDLAAGQSVSLPAHEPGADLDGLLLHRRRESVGTMLAMVAADPVRTKVRRLLQ